MLCEIDQNKGNAYILPEATKLLSELLKERILKQNIK